MDVQADFQHKDTWRQVGSEPVENTSTRSYLEEFQQVAEHLELEGHGRTGLQGLLHGSVGSRLQQRCWLGNKQEAQPFQSLLLHLEAVPPFEAAFRKVVEGDKDGQQLLDVGGGAVSGGAALQDACAMPHQLPHHKEEPVAVNPLIHSCMHAHMHSLTHPPIFAFWLTQFLTHPVPHSPSSSLTQFLFTQFFTHSLTCSCNH